ncbi:MAG: hypothetical protein EXR70_17620 [Deltaproteobacteria bacterium]|nr:hypothetical protein [Deltaproteobacteria bacterium]
MHRWMILTTAFSWLLLATGLQAQDRRLERLVVANGVISENRVPIWIAKELGLFEKYGLDVQIIFISGAGLSVAAIVGGDVHLAIAAGTPAVAAAARGAPIVILATLGPTEYQLVAQPAVASISQLKGKTIGVANFGAGDYFVLRRLLPKLGLTEKDVNTIPVGVTLSYEKLRLLQAGKIAATLSTIESVARFEREGNKLSRLADTLKEGIEVSGTDIFTSRQFLKNYPNRVKNFLRAFGEGIAIGMKDKELVYRVVGKYMKVEERKLLEVMVRYRYLLGPNPQKPYPLTQALELDLKDMGTGVAPEFKGKNAADYIDSSLIRELEKDGVFSLP